MPDVTNRPAAKTWCYWEGDMPPVISACMHTLERHNPEFALLDPDDVATMGGGDILDLTAGRSPQVRADLVRLWLLAEFGGQWIDSDCVALAPLDMYCQLDGDVELVGFGNGAAGHFSNTIMAARQDGELIREALDRARQVIASRPTWQQIPYGATGQGVLGPMYAAQTNRMRRCQRWRYAPIHFSRAADFRRRHPDGVHCSSSIWHGNARSYHLTNKAVAVFRDFDIDRLCQSSTFLGFLFRRATGRVRPRRAREILARIPGDRPLRGVEVGVLRGHNSATLLQQRPLLHLTLVDRWSPHPDGGTYVRSGDANAVKGAQAWRRIRAAAGHATRFAGERVRVIAQDSVTAAPLVADGSLDFVFIDGDHSYAGCAADIAAWSPKVKPGGWIGGHDYAHRREANGQWGVSRAVNEFAERQGSLETAVDLASDLTWFVRL